MPRIAINFDEVPDKVPQVAPGIYPVKVKDARLEENKKKTGENMVLELTVEDSTSPEHGRPLYSYTSMMPPHGPINCKHILLSCGVPLSKDGFEVTELIGKIGRVRVEARNYVDEKTGETKEGTQIKEWLH